MPGYEQMDLRGAAWRDEVGEALGSPWKITDFCHQRSDR